MTPKETLDFVNNKDLLKEGEVWKQHPIYTKYYGSNMGRIKYFNRHNKEMIKIQNLDKKNNRFFFCIHGIHYNEYNGIQKEKNRVRRFRTARFICECFYGINETLHVDHINTVCYDNRLENLRFCTVKENNNNPNTLRKGKKRKGFFRIEQLDLNGNLIKLWDDYNDIKSSLKLSTSEMQQIHNTCSQKRKEAFGYIWKRHQEPDLCGEKWKKHPQYDILVSNKGRIKRIDRRTKDYYVTKGHEMDGFLITGYNKKLLLVHRLVAETFIPNPQNYPYVYHINGDAFDNKVKNLTWSLKRDLVLEK